MFYVTAIYSFTPAVTFSQRRPPVPRVLSQPFFFFFFVFSASETTSSDPYKPHSPNAIIRHSGVIDGMRVVHIRCTNRTATHQTGLTFQCHRHYQQHHRGSRAKQSSPVPGNQPNFSIEDGLSSPTRTMSIGQRTHVLPLGYEYFLFLFVLGV